MTFNDCVIIKRQREKDSCLSYINISLCDSYTMAECGICQDGDSEKKQK